VTAQGIVNHAKAIRCAVPSKIHNNLALSSLNPLQQPLELLLRIVYGSFTVSHKHNL
jgi:hypothetical protein